MDRQQTGPRQRSQWRFARWMTPRCRRGQGARPGLGQFRSLRGRLPFRASRLTACPIVSVYWKRKLDDVTHSLTHSLTHSSWLTLVAGALVATSTATAVRAQRLPYSTHDWQLQAPSSQLWSTAWSDVKVPGDGRTYSLGTTWTDHTDHSTFALTFSGLGGIGSSSPTQGPGIAADGAGAIAAVLQVTDAQQNIVWQRFFHGDRGTPFPMVATSTHGRAVSVFPGATDLETRIAICGETQDARLPLSALQNGAESGLPPWESAGFVAVYDGRGTLRWTYLFYGNDKNASTAITDVAIHVDNRGPVPLDVVTYCGLSINGSYDPNPLSPTATPLTPLNPFPVGFGTACDVYASGDEVNHPFNATIMGPDVTQQSLQWDGIVGRLARAHDGSGPIERRFHSIVGGYPDNEGLFGITEKSLDEFAVVGTTMSVPGQRTVVPIMRSEWRGTPVCLTGGTYVHGFLVEFDAQLTDIPPSMGGPGPLVLTASTLIGASDPAVQTVARDVLWHGGRYYAVGSTTGRDFTIGWPLDGVVGLQSSVASGYLVATASSSEEFQCARYFPTHHDGEVSGLVGVAAWNEYSDHVSVLGWVESTLTQPNQPRDLYVASLFHDEIGLPPNEQHWDVLREHTIQSPGDEVAGALDHNGAYGVFWRNWINYQYLFGLGDLGGGGLAVDPRGLLNVVGTTRETPAGATGYPVTPGARLAAVHPNPQPMAMNPRPMDGVRTVVDLLPNGAFRSDGTGDPALGWAPVGNGGTTPACALSSFGNLVGATPPALNRMFLDYEGVPFPGAPVSLLVDQPPPASWVVASSWQVGVPSPGPVYLPDHDVEVWVVPGSAQATVPMLPTGGSTRQVFTGVPPGFSYLVQYVCLLAVPLSGTPCTGTDLTWAASPAMLFAY